MGQADALLNELARQRNQALDALAMTVADRDVLTARVAELEALVKAPETPKGTKE